MRLPSLPRVTPIIALTTTALALGACSSGVGQPTSSATSAPVAGSTSPTVTMDWTVPEKAQLPDGWSLAACSGEAPMICVSRGGDPVGQMEKLAFEVSTLPELAKVLSSQGEAAALEDHARRFVADFAKDRAQGCTAGYTVTADPSVRVSTPDGQALRYGFTGTLAGGAPSEKIAHYATIRNNQLVLLVANASDPGGCLHDPEANSFTSAQLQAFLPLLDQLVTSGGVPMP